MTSAVDEADLFEAELPPDDFDLTELAPPDTATWFNWFRLRLAILSLLLLFVALLFWNRMVVTVHAGEQAVLWHRFTGMNLNAVYYDGIHLILPFDIMTIYDMRLGRVDQSIDVLSTDGLNIKVDVSALYRPISKTLPYLHDRVGPDYVNRIVIPEVGTAVREVIGKYTPEQVYTARNDETQKQIRDLAAERASSNYVQIQAVLIRQITLPPMIVTAIQKKLTQSQELEEYKSRIDIADQEATRKRKEALGIADWERIVKTELTPDLLRFKGIDATLELAKSNNTKVVVIGGKDGLPVLLNSQ